MRDFYVSVKAAGWYGGGHLRVEPGRLTVTPDKVVRTLSGAGAVEQTSGVARWHRTRLDVPWQNAGVVVTDESRYVLATPPIWDRREVRRELEAAGFQIVEERSWINSRRALLGAQDQLPPSNALRYRGPIAVGIVGLLAMLLLSTQHLSVRSSGRTYDCRSVLSAPDHFSELPREYGDVVGERCQDKIRHRSVATVLVTLVFVVVSGGLLVLNHRRRPSSQLET